MTPESSSDLAWALLPVRLLLAFFVVAGGIALARGVVGAAGRGAASRVAGPRTLGVGAGVSLALALQLFVGIDLLSALIPLAGVWLLTLVAAVMTARRAQLAQRRPAARWLGGGAAWLLVTGMGLPVALIVITGNGAIPSCGPRPAQ